MPTQQDMMEFRRLRYDLQRQRPFRINPEPYVVSWKCIVNRRLVRTIPKRKRNRNRNGVILNVYCQGRQAGVFAIIKRSSAAPNHVADSDVAGISGRFRLPGARGSRRGHRRGHRRCGSLRREANDTFPAHQEYPGDRSHNLSLRESNDHAFPETDNTAGTGSSGGNDNVEEMETFHEDGVDDVRATCDLMNAVGDGAEIIEDMDAQNVESVLTTIADAITSNGIVDTTEVPEEMEAHHQENVDDPMNNAADVAPNITEEMECLGNPREDDVANNDHMSSVPIAQENIEEMDGLQNAEDARHVDPLSDACALLDGVEEMDDLQHPEDATATKDSNPDLINDAATAMVSASELEETMARFYHVKEDDTESTKPNPKNEAQTDNDINDAATPMPSEQLTVRNEDPSHRTMSRFVSSSDDNGQLGSLMTSPEVKCVSRDNDAIGKSANAASRPRPVGMTPRQLFRNPGAFVSLEGASRQAGQLATPRRPTTLRQGTPKSSRSVSPDNFQQRNDVNNDDENEEEKDVKDQSGPSRL